MRVLILTPVLNGAAFLDEAIRSVRAQTYADWTQIILDAGSDDGSCDIARRHAAEDDRVQLVERPDNGIYDALAYGFQSYAGDVHCWLNSDDLLTPWALQTAVAALREPGRKWVSGLPGLWNADGEMVAVYPRAGYSQARIREGWHHDEALGCLQQESLFWRADLFSSLSSDDRDTFRQARLAGDFFLWRCFARTAALHTVPSVLGGYRVHGANRAIVEQSGYQAEADALGAKRIARPLARLMRAFDDWRSAIATLRSTRAAAARLHQDKAGPS